MRNRFVNLISLFFVGLGLITSLWVTSSFIGKASSQEAPTMDLPPPSADIPPPDAGSIPQDPGAGMIPQQNMTPPQPGMMPPPEMAQPADLPPPPVDTPLMGQPDQMTQGYVPEVPGSDGYVYDPTGRRDPFSPFGGAPVPLPMQTESLLPVQPENLDPLQSYDLSQLVVVGIIWQVSVPKAVVKDPLGKVHMVKKDTKIGRNNGFVAAIREGEIVVVEPIVGEGGLPSASTRVMSLIR